MVVGTSCFSCRLVHFALRPSSEAASGGVVPQPTASNLLPAGAKLQLELPALERGHHAAKFVPGDLSTIRIAFDAAAQDQVIIHLRAVVGVLRVVADAGPYLLLANAFFTKPADCLKVKRLRTYRVTILREMSGSVCAGSAPQRTSPRRTSSCHES